MFGLEPDISLLDCRVKPGNDRKRGAMTENKEPGNDKIKK